MLKSSLQQKWESYVASVADTRNPQKNIFRQQILVQHRLRGKRQYELLAFLEVDAQVWFAATTAAFQLRQQYSDEKKEMLKFLQARWKAEVTEKLENDETCIDPSIQLVIHHTYSVLEELWICLKQHFESLIVVILPNPANMSANSAIHQSSIELQRGLKAFEDHVERLPVLSRIFLLEKKNRKQTTPLVSLNGNKIVLDNVDETDRLCARCQLPLFLCDHLGDLVCSNCTRLEPVITNIAKEMFFNNRSAGGGGAGGGVGGNTGLNANMFSSNLGSSAAMAATAQIPRLHALLMRQNILQKTLLTSESTSAPLLLLEDGEAPKKEEDFSAAMQTMATKGNLNSAKQHQPFINKMKTVWVIPSSRRKSKLYSKTQHQVDDKTLRIVFKKIHELVEKKIITSFEDFSTICELESLRKLIKREDKIDIKVRLTDLWSAVTGLPPPTVTTRQLQNILLVREYFDPIMRAVWTSVPQTDQIIDKNNFQYQLGPKRSKVRHYFEALVITMFLGYHDLAKHVPVVTDDQHDKHVSRAKLALILCQNTLQLQNIQLPTLMTVDYKCLAKEVVVVAAQVEEEEEEESEHLVGRTDKNMDEEV